MPVQSLRSHATLSLRSHSRRHSYPVSPLTRDSLSPLTLMATFLSRFFQGMRRFVISALILLLFVSPLVHDNVLQPPRKLDHFLIATTDGRISALYMDDSDWRLFNCSMQTGKCIDEAGLNFFIFLVPDGVPFQDRKPQLTPGDENPLALPSNKTLTLLGTAIPEITDIIDGSNTQKWFAIKISVFIAVLIGFCVCSFLFCKLRQSKQITKKKKSKKKRAIKAVNKKENVSISEGDTDSSSKGNEDKMLESFPDFVTSPLGDRVGKLLVSNKEIAKGSNGTVVLEGSYDGRVVAVKRLVQTHYEVARKEVANLIASDSHPNIVRYHGYEKDKHFIYISLERCACSLNDLIYESSRLYKTAMAASSTNPIQITELWKENGHPSPVLLKLMRDIVAGLMHLHHIGIIHRDLKPQNVLIVKNPSLCAKLSDMGISKHLPANTSALTRNVIGSGSSGWQAPEQLRNERQTRAVDLFSFGCVLFFSMTAGKHPYGDNDNYERDTNILNGQKDLFLVDGCPEAVELLSSLLHPDPNLRPIPEAVLHHPLFWDSPTRLWFLREASDRVEQEKRVKGSQLLAALESTAVVILDGCSRWDKKLDSLFLKDIVQYRQYDFHSMRDLLRVIRNKLNHYGDLPKDIQELLGSVPEGFDLYFSSRFPKLLIQVYIVLFDHCKGEKFLQVFLRTLI